MAFKVVIFFILFLFLSLESNLMLTLSIVMLSENSINKLLQRQIHKILIQKSLMNQKVLLLLALTFCAINSWQMRILQGWNDPNCASWSSDGSTCLKCIPRAYNNTQQGKCIRVDDNCKTWSQTNGECIKCYDSYGDAFKNGNAINGKCPYYNGPQEPQQPQQPGVGVDNTTNTTYDVNCRCYDDAMNCLECYKSYQLDENGICQPVLPSGCLKLANNVCVECDKGLFLTTQGNCEILPQNCTKIDESGNCTQCIEGFILTEEGNCTMEIMNCTKYGPDGSCIQCETGFYVDIQGECTLLPEHCLIVNLQGNCTSCQQGWVLDMSGDCIEIPMNCNVTDENGICIECLPGFYLDKQSECIQLPAKCILANSKGVCLQCEKGYVVKTGQCIKFVGPNPDCASQDDQGLCLTCRKFYELVNGTCIPTGQNPNCKQGACECGTGRCLQCKKGYFLDNHGICTAIGHNCQQYSKFNGSCTSCKTSFKLVKGQCVPENKPSMNLDCKQQDSDGNCTSCRRYYKLQNGECIPTGKNPKCSLWSSDKKTCLCCYYPDRFYLDNNNICVPKSMNCDQIDPQTGECTKCDSNYQLKKGKCISTK